MTNILEGIALTDKTKNTRTLTVRQKLLFGLVCWGVQSRSQAESFKTNGFDQKYRDAKKAMRTGLIIYGVGITLFILLLWLL